MPLITVITTGHRIVRNPLGKPLTGWFILENGRATGWFCYETKAEADTQGRAMAAIRCCAFQETN